MKKYTPRYSDPRVRRKIETALAFVQEYFNPRRPRPCHRDTLDQYLGKSNHDLGGFLRQNLLCVVDKTWSITEHKCKTYTLNSQGYRQLVLALQGNTESLSYLQYADSVVLLLTPQQRAQFSTGQFRYYEKNHRLWNSIQNIPTEIRTQIQAAYGYCDQYDIDTAAPRLISQRAQQLKSDLQLPCIQEYLGNKQKIREQIHEVTGIEISHIKQIITATFAGARLARNHRLALVRDLGLTWTQIQLLSAWPWWQAFKAEIKSCWQIISDQEPREYIQTRSGHIRSKAWTSRQKWSLYFRLERQVMQACQQYLDARAIRYFIEHDGWVSDTEIDIPDLITYVNTQTDYVLQFSHKKLS